MSSLLEMKGISKSFARNAVLKNVSFSVAAGEVHALLGENGAGKSTLVKILGGVYSSDSGQIYLGGKKLEYDNVLGAQSNGISIIHQELMLMPHLSIAENIFMGRELSDPVGLLDKKAQEARAQRLLDDFDLRVNAKTRLGDLTIAQQQMVEIIRAISFQAKIVAMDEPTSSLSEREAERLFELINTLKAKQVGIIFISHRLKDIFALTDRITVLRDGECVGTVQTKETNNDELIRMMVGRDITAYYSVRQRDISDEYVMQVDHLSDGKMVKDVSFGLRKGEILGFSGLVGAGRSETMQCLFGLSRRKAGTVSIEGKAVRFRDPREAMENGVGLVCEDRKKSGLFLRQDVRFNTSINVLERFLSPLRYDKGVETALAQTYVDKMETRITGLTQSVRFLSGGNQQKVLISRWLACTSKILLLDEPTRGVDVKTKEDIYRLIGELTEQGISIVFVSSELAELLNVCDRIVVMSNGTTTGVLNKEQFDQEYIMRLATKAFIA